METVLCSWYDFHILSIDHLEAVAGVYYVYASEHLSPMLMYIQVSE